MLSTPSQFGSATMPVKQAKPSAFPSARDDVGTAVGMSPATAQTRSPSYRLAFDDTDFLLRPELRAVRLQLELLKAELIQQEACVESTVVIFGSTRIPDRETAKERLADAIEAASARPDDPAAARQVTVARRVVEKSHYYDEARRLAQIITRFSQDNGHRDFVVVTGGGPGIMEAANRGAADVGGKSVGLSIVLPHEEQINRFVTPELSFQFHYFAVRKLHFLMRARALVAFPGGFGTLDELFETLTLIQTGRVERVPVLLFGEDYWRRIIDFDALIEEGAIDPDDLRLFRFVETAAEAWERIANFYAVPQHDDHAR